MTKNRENSNKVKRKMQEIIKAEEGNGGPVVPQPTGGVDHTYAARRTEENGIKAQKLIVRIGFIKESAASLEKESEKLVDIKDMNDAEVREGMEVIKILKKEASELNARRAKAVEECVGIDVNPEVISEMKEAVKSAVEIVNEKLEELILEDKNRCLYSNVKKSVLKENIVFPEVFSGKSGEVIYLETQKR